jgi:hypothetical protein
MESLTIIETILRNRRKFFTEIRQRIDIRSKLFDMFISCVIFLGIYGLVMGASYSPLQALASMIKLPVLFLVTLLICAPSLHFFNILFGSKQTLGQTLALILTAICTTSVLLFSLAPITFFFLISSTQYEFFLLLNVVFFIVAGFLGIVFLQQGMRVVTETEDEREGIQTRRLIFTLWILLYAFVGTQMAWTLSPFVGAPGQPFMLFTKPGSNFYTYVLQSVSHLIGWR